MFASSWRSPCSTDAAGRRRSPAALLSARARNALAEAVMDDLVTPPSLAADRRYREDAERREQAGNTTARDEAKTQAREKVHAISPAVASEDGGDGPQDTDGTCRSRAATPGS